MLNHTYTSVNNANLVDCGKKQHIPSQPSALLRDNFLGEYRTELDKKKVLANLGIVTDLLLEWEYIKGDIGKNATLMQELDSRTKYISEIDGFQKTLADGIKYLETVIGSEEEKESIQDNRLSTLETSTESLLNSLNEVKTYLETSVDVSIEKLETDLATITEKVNNITELIQVSNKEGNALRLLGQDELEEGETIGLYVPDLSQEVSESSAKIIELQDSVGSIQESLDTFVTKEELGGGDFDFVDQDDFDNYTDITDEKIAEIQEGLKNTVKTGEDGHVDTLYVNKISKNNDGGNIKITDSFEVESGIPLDVRFVKETLEELCSIPVNMCYPGMGVIVNSLSSLYILRNPGDGISLSQEYVSDVNNWKCPEDLVIEVITQEDYDAKVEAGTINPHMFYYIHEEVVEEPLRKDFDSDEAYAEALNRWLRVLQQKYMSAVWGQEIESLVASKASNTAVKSLESEIQRLSELINSLSGGTTEINVKDLNDQVLQNRTDIDILINEDGTIPTIQKDLADLQQTVTDNYVTIESITKEAPNVEYIFLKKSDFDTYKTTHDTDIAKEIITEKVTADSIVLGSHTITTEDSSLLFNQEAIALSSQIPIIEVLDSSSFESKTDIYEDTYYMVYDTEERYVPDSEFTEYKTSQSQVVRNLSENITKQQTSIGELSNLTTENKNTLVLAINELVTKITDLTNEVNTLKEQLTNSQPIE